MPGRGRTHGAPFTNPYSGALRIFVQRVLHGRSPVVYEDGMQLRDYVPVWDVARANLLALDDPRANFRALNVGGGKAITVLEYAHRDYSEQGFRTMTDQGVLRDAH
ncbi:MAG: NAD-dependent epimerase/dehydratase family protein [Chloroflexi bacterium]|nr:NAD-dependent epimerase/dehydratase family protein [Chloroflexota bacterium]